MTSNSSPAAPPRPGLKAAAVRPLRFLLRTFAAFSQACRRLYAHASLAAQIRGALPISVVVLGPSVVYGTGRLRIGSNALLYPDLHFETHDSAEISIGNNVVISRGANLVAMAGIHVGDGSMIGEYTSIRDANHSRVDGAPIRDSGHNALPVVIGREVWIGRGAAILCGVHIGDFATVGANAVVTRDVPAGTVVGGVPARILKRTREQEPCELSRT